MITITHENTNQYFEEVVVDAIFESINNQILQSTYTLTPTGIGCFGALDIQTKIGLKNVYVEYHYTIEGSMNQSPLPIKVKPHEVLIFDGMPEEISNKINKVKLALSDYSKLN